MVIGNSGMAVSVGRPGHWIRSAFVQRITRLETFFEVLGKKAANILHSPHTPELDSFIEKYVSDKMLPDDWQHLLRLVDDVEGNLDRPKEERALAAMVAAACRKKLNLQAVPPHSHLNHTP